LILDTRFSIRPSGFAFGYAVTSPSLDRSAREFIDSLNRASSIQHPASSIEHRVGWVGYLCYSMHPQRRLK
jgi:hypothetical protein